MDTRLATFASELTKIAAQQQQEQQRRPGLIRAGLGVAATAVPYQAAMSVAGVPKGVLDRAVEQTIRGTKDKSLLRVIGESGWKGISRGASTFPAGLITAPVFISGMQDLRSRDPDRQQKGYAKVISSGAAFSAMKGGGEAFIDSFGRRDVAKALGNVKGTALARAVTGGLAATLTAGAVAKATATDRPKERKSLMARYGIPTLVGAAAGGAKGAFEEAVLSGQKATTRGIAAKASGRAAAGALGALVLAEAVKRLLPSKKNPKVKRWQRTDKPMQKISAQQVVDLGPSQSGIYDQTRNWAKKQNDVDVYKFYKQVNDGGLGERSPSRRAAFYALHDELGERGHEMPALKMRGEVTPKLVKAPGLLSSAALVSVALTPALAHHAVMLLHPSDRDVVLGDALDKMIIQKGILRKNVNPRAPLFDIPVISEALGRTPSRMRSPHYSEGMDAAGKRVGEVVLRQRGRELPGIAAHELGHASSGPARKVLQRALMTAPASLAHTAGTVASVVIPLLAMDGVGDGSFTTASDLESRAKLVAGLGVLTGAMQAPLIAEETIANVKALKYLRQAGAELPEAALKAMMHAGPGYATYLAPAAIPFLAAAHLKIKAMQARRGSNESPRRR